MLNVGDFLNELSNDGAKHQFEKYVTQDILPVMVHCAQVSCSSGCLVVKYLFSAFILPYARIYRKPLLCDNR